MDASSLAPLLGAQRVRERCRLLGHREEVLELVSACDATVLPAIKREGLPKTVIESMALGVAPIVTRTGGRPELIVHGDEEFPDIGKTIEQIEMPRGATIGAIVRGAGDKPQVLMAHHDTVIQPEDHLIVFVENKRIIPRVEKLYSVGLGFF